MRSKLAVLLLLLLSACIEVGDLGRYWEQGSTDLALVGHWEQERADGVRETNPKSFNLTIKDRMYSLVFDSEPGAPIKGRTLTAGKYTFFMTEPTGRSEAVLYRYTSKLGVIQLYDLNSEAMLRWLRLTYPSQKGIRSGDSPGIDLSLDALDEAGLGVVSQIPDGELYWRKTDGELQRYRKLP